MESFDSIAEDVVGAIIKKACQGVEDRLDALEAGDDIWPSNGEYSLERGREAILRCIQHRYGQSSLLSNLIGQVFHKSDVLEEYLMDRNRLSITIMTFSSIFPQMNKTQFLSRAKDFIFRFVPMTFTTKKNE